MEGTSIIDATEILKKNIIGPEELAMVSTRLGVPHNETLSDRIPPIPFTVDALKEVASSHLLVLGIPFFHDNTPLNILKLREHHGLNPNLREPCFYNQDWYIKEQFVSDTTIDFKWYLIRKEVNEASRSKFPGPEQNSVYGVTTELPSALLCTYTFFAWLLLTNEILWKNDYVWCRDQDANGDQIYVGRYVDSKGINKNGFSIHRHLTITNIYGTCEVLTT